MKLKDKFFLSFKYLKKRKEIFTTILFIILSSMLIIIAISLNSSLTKYWNDCIDNMVDYRTFYVYPNIDKNESKESAVKKLKKMKNVISVESSSSRVISAKVPGLTKKEENGIDLIGSIDKPVSVVIGEDLSKYSESEYPIICPSKFYPYIGEKIEEFDKNKLINLNNRVGKKIDISLVGFDEVIKFKLVGLYDTKNTNSRGDSCYTKSSIVSKLNEKFQKDVFIDDENTVTPLIVVIDNVRNAEIFLDNINKAEMITAGAVKKIAVNSGDKIANILNIICIFFCVIYCIIYILVIFKNYENDKKDFGLLHSIGYIYKDIEEINDIRELIIFIFGLIISIFISFLLMSTYLNNIVGKLPLLEGIKIEIFPEALLVCIIVNVALYFVGTLIIKRKLEKEKLFNLIIG